MTQKENAHPIVAAMEREAAGTAAFSRAAISCPDSNMIAVERQPKISDLLHTGSENGVTLSELVQLTGEDERLIRRRIQRERKSGKLILSDSKSGYFLPATEEDVKRFIRSMSRRAREIRAVAHIADDILARMTGQESLEGWNV